MCKQATEFLLDIASMRHIPNITPTWKFFGLQKACKCKDRSCLCPKLPKSSCIDNACISLGVKTNVNVLEDAIADHCPLLVKLLTTLPKKSVLSTIWRRDTNKISSMGSMEFESALISVDWSNIYDTDDPNTALFWIS